MKVAIITNFAKIQQIDEFPALINVGEDNIYNLGSQTDHDLSYVPLNWKREMEKLLKHIELKWAQRCNPEHVTECKIKKMYDNIHLISENECCHRMYFIMNDDNVQFITKMCVVIHDNNMHYEYIKNVWCCHDKMYVVISIDSVH